MYPRLRDLPQEEQTPFKNWLHGQTQPICNPEEPRSEWDWYFPWDYEQWKAGLPCTD